MNYVAHTRIITQGAVTGIDYSLRRGDTVEAPEDEFRHLPDGDIRSVEGDDGEEIKTENSVSIETRSSLRRKGPKN